MKSITIRGIDTELSEKMKDTAAAKGKSINQMVLEFIRVGLGLQKERQYSREYDDLDDLFGQWSEIEFKAVWDKTSQERCIDPELWQ
jgi:hypothetical protein